VRSAILIFLAILAFETMARAQSTWLERSTVSAICSRTASPAAGERLARRLNLTDPQKSALRDLTDAFASADASAKKSLCADKRIFLRRRDAWRSPKRWRRSGLPVSRQSSPSFKRFMTPWTRGRRERSTLAAASAAYSTGGARHKGRTILSRRPPTVARREAAGKGHSGPTDS